MPDESFFVALGGLGVTLAGFAGLISALDRSPGARSPIAAYRLRNIVVLGFWLTFTGLGTVALYDATSNVTVAIRVGTAFLAVRFVRGLTRDSRPGPAWTSEAERRMAILLLVLMLGVSLPNLVIASPGYLQLLMVMALIGPISIFYNTIRASIAPVAVASEADPGSKPT